MTTGDGAAAEHPATLRDYLHVARRQKVIIAVATVVVTALALAYSVNQKPVYEASANVLLSTQNLAYALTGTQSQSLADTPDRVAATQAELARVPEVVDHAIKSLHVPLTTTEFLSESSVTAQANADILTFTVDNGNAALVPRMASAYARAYTAYRRQLDTATLRSARAELQARLALLRKQKQGSSALYASLAEKDQQLKTLEALQTANASVVQVPSTSSQVSPHVKRDTVLGFLLGLVVGVGLAFLREALDTRVRTAPEVSTRLGLPLLARLPAPPREVAEKNRLVAVAHPKGPHAEAFRMLRTNLGFASLDRDVRTVMVTSAVEGEGKTTTAANLAVTLARAGQRVILVDLDLRRASIGKFFDLRGRPGLTQVVMRYGTLDDALVPVPLPLSRLSLNGNEGRHDGLLENTLHVLGAGPAPPDPGEFVATPSLGELLGELRDRADMVVIDAPPLLRVGDPLVLGPKVDGMLIITRLQWVRRPMLNELRRLLEPMPTLKLGFVVTGAEAESEYGGYGYGASAYYIHQRASEPSSWSRPAQREPTA